MGTNNEFYIRDADEGDIEAITLLMSDLGYPNTVEEMEAKMRNIFLHPDYRTILAVLNKEIVGFSGLMKGFSFERSGKYVRIISFVVKKSARNKGIAKQLIKASEEWAIEQGADSVVISSGNRDERLDAHAFYQKSGYIIKSSGFFKAMPQHS
jgi:GNAT superfamily N-acetyltransferase